ncbi:hypothetical protein BKA70DRAFT_1395870 [Coprinopsis sp. MPI-PUGE-AT-0042]|nr:hypothetical protein BKA70DRAFT_1395870 [Coprinopsis sp. MPI-PUGE-AT-0042]
MAGSVEKLLELKGYDSLAGELHRESITTGNRHRLGLRLQLLRNILDQGPSFLNGEKTPPKCAPKWDQCVKLNTGELSLSTLAALYAHIFAYILGQIVARFQKTAEVADDLKSDEFLSELEFPASADVPASIAVPQEEEVEEPIPIEEEGDAKTKAEKHKAETAKKGKDIVPRHVDWQKQLDELFDAQEKRVWVDIYGAREWVVSELGEEFAPKDVEKHKWVLTLSANVTPGLPDLRYKWAVIAKGEGLGSIAIEGINKQGGRFICGLETDLGSLEYRKSGNERNRTASLTVEEKFGKLTTDVQGDVHKWYAGISTRENEVINEAAEAIRRLAEQAQADIAMDYAWLDDVSTKDWANYHELMTITSSSFKCENEDTPERTFRIKNEKGKRVDDAREYLQKAKEKMESGIKDAGNVAVGKDPVVAEQNVKNVLVERVEL